MGKLIDLTGKRFGRWTVIERAENNTWGGIMWSCVCDCGTERVVREGNLKDGRSTSCGCPIDLFGQRFGRLTVIEKVKNGKWGKVRWACLCDCGNKIDVTGEHLKRGNTKSCGCLKSPPLAKRFWSKVIKGASNECWEWQAGLTHDGYGRFNIKGKTHCAHRIAWELTYGPIPDGLFACHACDNPKCVNPEHLLLGTIQSNSTDMVNKGRSSRGERNGRAVLNPQKVRAIRHIGRSKTLKVISEMFGVSHSAISYVLRGKTWVNV